MTDRPTRAAFVPALPPPGREWEHVTAAARRRVQH